MSLLHFLCNFFQCGILTVSGEENLCLFRCLAMFNNAPDVEAAAQRARSRWTSQYGPLTGGVNVSEMDRFEVMFDIGVAIYARACTNQPGVLRALRRPTAAFRGRCMSIMADESYSHADLMISAPIQCDCCGDFFVDKAARTRKCTDCGREFAYHCRLMRHRRNGQCPRSLTSKISCKKCGTDFDVAASFTAHTSICGDKGPLADPTTSSTPARGVDKVTRKQRTIGSLTPDKEADLFQLLSDSSPQSTNQRSSEVLRRLVRVRDNCVVSVDHIKDLEVATGLRINVFSREWNEDHRRYFVTQIYTSTYPDMKAPKILIHAPDPNDLANVNLIKSMAAYSGVHTCR